MTKETTAAFRQVGWSIVQRVNRKRGRDLVQGRGELIQGVMDALEQEPAQLGLGILARIEQQLTRIADALERGR